MWCAIGYSTWRTWSDLISMLLTSHPWSHLMFDSLQLSTSQRQAIITLIDKKKDRIFLKNWRPISLLNVDYKLLSKTLSNRLTPILSTIKHPNQTGFMKGRNIAENIRILYDTIYCTRKAKQHGILLALDFEKAFDSLEWNFIFCRLY